MSAANKNSEPPQPESGLPDHVPARSDQQRLWTPWRMRYVAGGSGDTGCIFCNRLAENDDARTLILHRGEGAFVIMNLYPYNTGHVMIVPNAHVASPEDADAGMIAEMAALRGPVLRALRRALNAEGFNLGLNVGAEAGAGVSDHLHEHVVPRWKGDANFMPILAATMVMPELIPVTYAKLRAEMAREIDGAAEIISLTVSGNRMRVLVAEDGTLPSTPASEGEPLWRTALRDIHDLGAIDAELIGWGGASRAGSAPPALLFRADLPESHGLAAGHRLAVAEELFNGPNADAIRDVLERLTTLSDT